MVSYSTIQNYCRKRQLTSVPASKALPLILQTMVIVCGNKIPHWLNLFILLVRPIHEMSKFVFTQLQSIPGLNTQKPSNYFLEPWKTELIEYRQKKPAIVRIPKALGNFLLL